MIIEIPTSAPSLFACICNLCGRQSDTDTAEDAVRETTEKAGWKEAEIKSLDGGPAMKRHVCPDCRAAVAG